jgi:hypothetical protein
MVAVKHDDLAIAFDFVSFAAPMEHIVYVSFDTGKVYWTSDSSDTFDEDIPDDLETSDRYWRDGWKVDFRVRDSEFSAPATDM